MGSSTVDVYSAEVEWRVFATEVAWTGLYLRQPRIQLCGFSRDPCTEIGKCTWSSPIRRAGRKPCGVYLRKTSILYVAINTRTIDKSHRVSGEEPDRCCRRCLPDAEFCKNRRYVGHIGDWTRNRRCFVHVEVFIRCCGCMLYWHDHQSYWPWLHGQATYLDDKSSNSTFRNSTGWLSDWREMEPVYSILSPNF